MSDVQSGSPGAHGHPFSVYYSSAHDFPARQPSLTYFLGAIPRSGSTHIALTLWRTGTMGAPLEYLNVFDRGREIGINSDEALSYWNRLKTRRTSSNGVFGSKLFIRDLYELARTYPGLLPEVRADFLILLKRRHIVGQAVSYHRAEQSRCWIANHTAEVSSYSYHYDGILRSLLSIVEQESAWDKFVALTGAKPVTLFYEDFLNSQADEIARMQRLLGVVASEERISTVGDTIIQRDDLSSLAVETFLEELESRDPQIVERLSLGTRLKPIYA